MNFQELNEKLSNFDINDIDWNNMGSWPPIGKAIFAAIIFCAIFAAGYFFDVSDILKQLDSVQKKEVSLRQEFENKAFRVANIEAYENQLEEIETSFGALLSQLPRDTEVPGLLEDITKAAKGAALDINAIKLQPEVQTEYYTELPIDIDVDGEYHDFGAFVSAVAGLGRIVTLHDFSISLPNRNASGEASSNKLNLKIVAKTYRYSDEQSSTKPGSKQREKR